VSSANHELSFTGNGNFFFFTWLPFFKLCAHTLTWRFLTSFHLLRRLSVALAAAPDIAAIGKDRARVKIMDLGRCG